MSWLVFEVFWFRNENEYLLWRLVGFVMLLSGNIVLYISYNSNVKYSKVFIKKTFFTPPQKAVTALQHNASCCLVGSIECTLEVD